MLFAGANLHSEIILDRFEEYKFKPIMVFSVGFPFGQSADDFFKLYKSEFGSTQEQNKFTTTPSGNIAFKTWIVRDYRLGVSAGYHNINIFDDYYIVGEFLTRNHSNEIDFYTIPLLVKGEYIPYDKQFRSYVGAGLGLTMSNIRWKERVISSYPLDPRKSGVHFNEMVLSPTFELYSGIELGFDEYPESKFLGSIVFELDYRYSPQNVDIFKNAKKQLKEYSPKLDDKIAMFSGYFTFTVGLSFNLLGERLKAKN